MRITVTMTDLNETEWAFLHRVVQTSYEISDTADRVCLTFSRDGEDRHVEMPMHTYGSVLTSMALTKAMTAFGYNLSKSAQELGAKLKDQRHAADPARAKLDEEYVKGQGHGAGWND